MPNFQQREKHTAREDTLTVSVVIAQQCFTYLNTEMLATRTFGQIISNREM
jgi:hypothetical protein